MQVNFFCFLFFKKFLLLFNYTCLYFLPIPPPYHSQTHLPPPPPPSPLILSMCPLQQLLETPLPTIPSPLPSGYCQIVLNFNVSDYILFAFFFNYVPVKGEIIWYLSLTIWLISFSIMPVSYTHLTLPTRSIKCRSRWSPYH